MTHNWLFRLFAKHQLDDDINALEADDDYQNVSLSKNNSTKAQITPADSLPQRNEPRQHAMELEHAGHANIRPAPIVHSQQPVYSATCISFEIRRGSPNRYAVYRVLVVCGADQWWLFKSYRDFRELHAALRRELPRHGLPVLPPRRLFGDNLSKSFLARRRISLHAYLLYIVDDPITRKSAALLNFLDDGRHVLQKAMGIDPTLVESRSQVSTSSAASLDAPNYSNKASNMSKANLTTRQATASTNRRHPQSGSRSRAGSVASIRKGGEMRRLAPAQPVPRSRANSLTKETTETALVPASSPPPTSTTASPDSPTTTTTTTGSSSTSLQTPTKPAHKIGLDDFCLLSVIGKGSYGKVMLARHKATGKVYAIKAISKSKLRGRPADIRRVMSEREVLRRNASHPFLVGLRYSFQSAQKLYLCIDYVSGGELFFHLQRERRFPEARVRFYACEILSALEHLHSLGFIYRDLKPENLLLDSEGHIRLVDFGLTKNTGNGTTSTFCGTPEYLAPEVLRQQRYGKEVDWYCFGSVVYEMLVGLPPFYSPDDREMFDRILHEDVRFPSFVSKSARLLIEGLLQRNPALRLGSRGAEEVKRQPFFKNIDWGKVYRKEYPAPFNPNVTGTMDLHNIDPKFCGEPIPNSLLGEMQDAAYLRKVHAQQEQANFNEIFDVPGLDDDMPAHTRPASKPAYAMNTNYPFVDGVHKQVHQHDSGEYDDNNEMVDFDDQAIDPNGDAWDAMVDQAMRPVSEAEIKHQVDTAFVGFSYVPDGTLVSVSASSPLYNAV